MARKLEEFGTEGARGTSKYPWHEWADGDPWEIVQGVDFTVSLASMRAAALSHATSKGVKLRTKTFVREGREGREGEERGLVLQFWTPQSNRG